jgi:2,4-dienoyl-CoA reductase-like NADH-dependent reductase (Old Yellow Enzyme family)/flavin reductase (DIM6/NTAB) family NADH-FMN oxidoreductase RutF
VTDRSSALLFRPLAIGRGGLVLPNRIWLPAMVTWRGSEDGFVTESVREIYLRYALGGAGMIVLEATGIRDVASGPLLRLSHDRYVPGLKALREEMRAVSGSLAIPQLIDFLKIARRKPTREYVVAMVKRGKLPDSALALSDAEFEADLERYLPSSRERRDLLYGYRQTIEDLDLAEIRQIPGWFADAARRARQAGFEGVELHFAHAYTMASFLSVTNRRTDAYGGSFENRLRLPREVIAAVREQVGRDFLVGCRYLGSEDILGEDGTLGGNTLEDAKAIGVELARVGLDFLSVSRGGKFDDAQQPPVGEAAYPYTGHSGMRCIPRQKTDRFGVNTHLASGIRGALRAAGLRIPVVTAGKIHSFEQAESILREERADLIGMARALLADPDLPRKWHAGEERDLRACVFCPYCEHEDQHHRVVTCTLWPKPAGDHKKRLIPGVWREGERYDPAAPFSADLALPPPARSRIRSPMPIAADDFRRTLGQFATGVTVVTTRAAEGRPMGLTVNAFCSVSLDPPLVLACIDNRSETHGGFEASGVFGVSVLSEEQESWSRRFASPGHEKFAPADLLTGETGVALVPGALAHIECRVSAKLPGGDHTIYVGEVLRMHVSPGRPLLYHGSAYARLQWASGGRP